VESKERRNAVARAVLLWLDEAGESYPLVEDFLSSTWVAVGGERVGNDELVRTVRWLHDRGLVGGPEIDQVPYPVKLVLTRSGRLVVVEQGGWVEPKAATPDVNESKPSIHAVAQAFLLWLYGVDHLQPPPQKFLADQRSTFGSHQIDEAEMAEAVRLLMAKDLVAGTPSWQSGGIPLRIRLSDAGRLCVVERDGNVSPQATWDDIERGGGITVDKSITTTGNGNTVVGHSENVSISPDPRDRPDFIVERSVVGADSGHAIEVTMTSGPQQLHVSVEVAVIEPQEGVTASVADGETRRMVRDYKREVVVTLDPPVKDSDVVIEVIARCEDVNPPHERWALHRALTIKRPPRIF
jgi:hypothetical protein